MDRYDYTKKRKNLNTKRSIKVRERLGKIKYHIEALNIGKHFFELCYRGKHHRICLMEEGTIVARGLKDIEEYLWLIRYMKVHGPEL